MAGPREINTSGPVLRLQTCPVIYHEAPAARSCPPTRSPLAGQPAADHSDCQHGCAADLVDPISRKGAMMIPHHLELATIIVGTL
jgi:hypothetical protein